MKLREIYSNIDSDVEVTGLSINSKECKKGDIIYNAVSDEEAVEEEVSAEENAEEVVAEEVAEVVEEPAQEVVEEVVETAE